jgi:D-apiose dehydrogenase
MRGEDRAFIAMQTAGGAPVALLANLATHGRPAALSDRLTMIGTHGTIELDGDTLRCIGTHEDALDAALTYDMAACYLHSYAATIAHFVESLRTGSAFETGAPDNLRTLELVEAIYATP